MVLERLHGEESLILGNKVARATVTVHGGHVRIESRPSPDQAWDSPYSLPPWQPADHPAAPPVLQLLRGDFFCFPFGVTEGLALPHGETSNRKWTVEHFAAGSVRLRMDLEAMSGTVVKKVSFDPTSHALWQEHTITGVEGCFNYGHHPTLQVPAGSQADYSTSPWRFGQVHPDGLAVPADGDRGALCNGARFQDLAAVPATHGGSISLARYPHASAAEDLVMLAPTSAGIAWNAFSLPRFLWVSLRRTSDFPGTLLWLSNGGRPRPPWNGTHTGRIGIEDVCSYFHDGAHRSRLDLLAAEGIPTSRRFQADQPVVLQHLQVAIPTETAFGPVLSITFNAANNALIITGRTGRVLSWACPFSFANGIPAPPRA